MGAGAVGVECDGAGGHAWRRRRRCWPRLADGHPRWTPSLSGAVATPRWVTTVALAQLSDVTVAAAVKVAAAVARAHVDRCIAPRPELVDLDAGVAKSRGTAVYRGHNRVASKPAVDLGTSRVGKHCGGAGERIWIWR